MNMATTRMRTPQPHDLIWIDDPEAFVAGESLPDWADVAWLARAPVVVRRDQASDGGIPVGLRGRSRAQRHAAWLTAAQCARVMSPEAIARQARWRDHPRLAEIPALRELSRVAPRLDDRQLDWGVTGAIGFALASDIDVLHPGSDVDLLISSPTALSDAETQWLGALIDGAHEARLDIQVATPFGAFTLRERLRTGGRVLLRTATGPVLRADPWQPA
ncbi:malonate decarboxylase holo-ACP synthase [Cupriavidus sp. RAF12]|uniref:malonate decarboxylase holo-ACP synthase n=1 Tax=Cupriavidus sp. RAF12 TaxID=3233050 RepID=UPI003F8F3909